MSPAPRKAATPTQITAIGREREEHRKKCQAVGHQPHGGEGLGTGEQVAGQPLVNKADRQGEQLLQEHRKHEPQKRLGRACGAGHAAA